jgi:hypothetical protein
MPEKINRVFGIVKNTRFICCFAIIVYRFIPLIAVWIPGGNPEQPLQWSVPDRSWRKWSMFFLWHWHKEFPA